MPQWTCGQSNIGGLEAVQASRTSEYLGPNGSRSRATPRRCPSSRQPRQPLARQPLDRADRRIALDAQLQSDFSIETIVPCVGSLTPFSWPPSARDRKSQNSLTTVTSTLMMFRRFNRLRPTAARSSMGSRPHIGKSKFNAFAALPPENKAKRRPVGAAEIHGINVRPLKYCI